MARAEHLTVSVSCVWSIRAPANLDPAASCALVVFCSSARFQPVAPHVLRRTELSIRRSWGLDWFVAFSMVVVLHLVSFMSDSRNGIFASLYAVKSVHSSLICQGFGAASTLRTARRLVPLHTSFAPCIHSIVHTII